LFMLASPFAGSEESAARELPRKTAVRKVTDPRHRSALDAHGYEQVEVPLGEWIVILADLTDEGAVLASSSRLTSGQTVVITADP
jgi:hypothetical protein